MIFYRPFVDPGKLIVPGEVYGYKCYILCALLISTLCDGVEQIKPVKTASASHRHRLFRLTTAVCRRVSLRPSSSVTSPTTPSSLPQTRTAARTDVATGRRGRRPPAAGYCHPSTSGRATVRRRPLVESLAVS